MDNKEDNIQSINEFDYNLICEYFSSIDRQGPGSEESTLQALRFIDSLPQDACIADLGCGTGSSALVLASATGAQVTALDLFPLFIEKLAQRAADCGLTDRLHPIVGDMSTPPFEPESLDVIWSEGAIYNIGFARGLREWHRFLKPGGYIAVTESTWLTDERPQEIADFWNEAYPEMDTLPNKLSQLQAAGYTPIATFLLPETCWTDNYYIPQRKAQQIFLERHHDNVLAEEFIRNQRHEDKLYNRYKQYYGYVFYIGRKR